MSLYMGNKEIKDWYTRLKEQEDAAEFVNFEPSKISSDSPAVKESYGRTFHMKEAEYRTSPKWSELEECYKKMTDEDCDRFIKTSPLYCEDGGLGKQLPAD